MHIGPRARLRAVLASVLIVVAAIASADEIHLGNGDRYSGKVVSLDKGTLKFDTGHGVVDVPWGTVISIAITSPVMITLAGQPERAMTLLLAPDGSVALRYADRPDDTPQPVMLIEIRGIRHPVAPYSLTGGANAGFLTTEGNTDVKSLRLDGEIVARVHDNRYTANGSVNQASDNGNETARNATGTVRYDRFLTRAFYVNGSTIFTHDNFRDLDLRTAAAVGVGLQAADSQRATLAFEIGYGYVRENLRRQSDTRFHSARETVKLDLFFVGRRINLFHRQDGFMGFTDDNLFVQTHNGVRLGLLGGLVTTLQYDVDYDRSPAPGRKQTDTSLGVTFGYRF